MLFLLSSLALAEDLLTAGWTRTELATAFDTCLQNAGPSPTPKQVATCGCTVQAAGRLTPRAVAQNPDEDVPLAPEVEQQLQQALMACLTAPATQNRLDEALMFRYALDLSILVRPATETGWTPQRQTEALQACVAGRGSRRESSCACEVFSLARTVPWEHRASEGAPWAGIRQQVVAPCLEDVEGSPPFVVPWRR